MTSIQFRQAAAAITLILLSIPSFARLQSPADIIERLKSLDGYRSGAEFRVSMPQLDDDIRYRLNLSEQAAPGDPLATNAYLIDWTLENASDANHGFSAYFSGNHFRFSAQRLQEYHLEWDSIPFRPETISSRATPIHRNAQFFNFLPQAIAAEISSILSDSTCRVSFSPDTIVGGQHYAAIRSIKEIGGVTATEAEYLFHPDSALPARIRLENNPGSISEQSVAVDYDAPSGLQLSGPIDERLLIETYPDEFANFRQSNFSIERLAGRQLPAFSLPTITAERYSRRAGDPFRAATIVVLIEAESGFTPQLIAEVRKAAGRSPVDTDILWAFTDNVVDRVEPLVGPQRIGETTLISSRPLARDCGAATLPAIIIADRQGIARNIIVGFNNDLAADVIQKIALMN